MIPWWESGWDPEILLPPLSLDSRRRWTIKNTKGKVSLKAPEIVTWVGSMEISLTCLIIGFIKEIEILQLSCFLKIWLLLIYFTYLFISPSFFYVYIWFGNYNTPLMRLNIKKYVQSRHISKRHKTGTKYVPPSIFLIQKIRLTCNAGP